MRCVSDIEKCVPELASTQMCCERADHYFHLAIFSKSRYAEFGEKNTAYFLNLEKRNSAKKVISKLKLENGVITKDSNIILSQVDNFYTKNCPHLYTSVETSKETQILDTFFNGLEGLSKVNSDTCEGQIIEDELFSCLLYQIKNLREQMDYLLNGINVFGLT